MPTEIWIFLLAASVAYSVTVTIKGDTPMGNIYFSELIESKQDGPLTKLIDLQTDNHVATIQTDHMSLVVDVFHSLLTLDNVPPRQAALLVVENYDNTIVSLLEDPIDEISANLLTKERS